jgi:hypothetical protein
MNVSLGTGDSQAIHDRAFANIGKQINQICCQVNTALNAQINSGSNFMAFGVSGSSCGNNGTPKTDTLQIQCRDYTTNYGVTSLNDILVVKGDSTGIPFDKNNITASSTNVAASSTKIEVNDNKVKVTYKNDTIPTNRRNYPQNYNLTLAVTGDKKIPVTNFTVDFGLDLNQNGNVDMYKLKAANAGDWKYNGTTLKSPYVAVNGDTQTIFRVNNFSNVDAETYWTCTDDNGVEVSLLKVNPVHADSSIVPTNGAAAWLAADILKAAQDQNPDFAPNGKMRCSILVTTPAANQASGVEIMTINGGRDRVIPFN